VRAKKTRASGNDGNGLRSFSHFRFVLMAAAQFYQQEVGSLNRKIVNR